MNLATARVLARNGWRVVVPRRQGCCGALHAHHGQLETARALGRETLLAFGDADVVLSTAAGCSAHLSELGDLLGTDEASAFADRTRDVLAFLSEGTWSRPARTPASSASRTTTRVTPSACSTSEISRERSSSGCPAWRSWTSPTVRRAAERQVCLSSRSPRPPTR